MTDKTKVVNLTENELKELINYHGKNIYDNLEYRIERMNYLNKRLNTFKEPETEIKSDNSAAEWGTQKNV